MTIIFKNILNFFCQMFAAKISYVNVSPFLSKHLNFFCSDSHYFCTAYNVRFESVLPTPVTELIKYWYRIRNNPVFRPLNQGISEWM